MIRALYTAASGMNAQQANIDNVANNLANVNTTGFKKSRVEFEDLVYQQIKTAGTPTSQEAEAPIGLETGLGTRAVATARNFSTGNLRNTNNPLDLAIEGNGFFQVSLPGGETGYTRAGALHLNGQGQIVTADGVQIEPSITIPANATSVSISKDGIVSVCGARADRGAAGRHDRAGELPEPGRPAGARRQPVRGDDRVGRRRRPACPAPTASARLQQGFLEDSNVSVVEEMVNMILGQRAYEANSRVIRAADEMLQQVNQLVTVIRMQPSSPLRFVLALGLTATVFNVGVSTVAASGRHHARRGHRAGGRRADGRRRLGARHVARHDGRRRVGAAGAARSGGAPGPADAVRAAEPAAACAGARRWRRCRSRRGSRARRGRSRETRRSRRTRSRSSPATLPAMALRRVPAPGEVVGLKARRTIARGEALTSAVLITPPAVRSGDEVTREGRDRSR